MDVSNLLCDTNDEIEEFMRKFGCEDLLTWKESKVEQAAEDVFADLYRVWDFPFHVHTVIHCI